MEDEIIEGKIALTSVLLEVGFIQIEDNKWQFDFGNFKLNATRVWVLFEAIRFYGYYIGQRTAAEIDFKVPAYVDCFEQGVALIAYNLRNDELAYRPKWIEEGLANADLLPWSIERAAFARIPKAQVDREYFRLIVKKLKALNESVSDDTLVTFSFDGDVFKIVCEQEIILAPAKGKKWEQEASLLAGQLIKLPKRLSYNAYDVYIREGILQFGNYCYQLQLASPYPSGEDVEEPSPPRQSLAQQTSMPNNGKSAVLPAAECKSQTCMYRGFQSASQD